MEIEVQTPYDTKVGAGPIITGRNWRSSPRLNKIGAFSFEMPLNDPRRSYLVQKRYVRCYGMVDGTRTEIGKPGIIDSVVKEIDADGIPTGMLRVSGRDLLAELADINIHELSLIDTSTRVPDSIQYYDGTATAYIDMTDTYDENAGTSVEIPADDEDWFYFGDDAVFDLITFDLGANLNSDTNNWTLQYSQGGAAWAAGTVLSDTTKVDNASFAQDGAIRWERQEDWATDTVNAVADKYWVRIRYKEDMSGDVTVKEITLTQDVPTTTALADWLAYTDAAAGTPISDLGWDFWATHQATENTVFLILRDVSAFEALTLIAEQTGENFRLGTGRLIDWLQNDKTASGIRATNISDGIAAEDNEDICLITNLRQAEDSYEMVSRVYPQGGGRGSTRVTLLECTESAPAGYTLSKSANYLKKDATETDYGRRIEISKFWPNLASPRQGSSRDVNSSNGLYKLAYEYLERHCTPQTSYIFSVVKLDAAVEVGETIQLVYWQTVEGTAVWNLGISTALHLWVLEMTHAVDEADSRVVAMQVATIDTWPSSNAGKVKSVVSYIKALQSTDGPVGALSLTPSSVADILGSLDLSIYTKRNAEETITEEWLFERATVPGAVSIKGASDAWIYSGLYLVDDTTKEWGIKHHKAAANLNDLEFSYSDDDGASWTSPMWLHHTGDLEILGNYLIASAKYIGIAGNEIITFQAAGTIDFTGADVTMDNDLTVTNDILLSDGSVIGITGNEVITFQAAGTIDFTGADVTMSNDLTVTNDIILLDGAVVGIAGNEVLTFNAAGTIAITGADVLLGSQDGLGKLNFDEGTTVANGIAWGSDANKVTLYRSADDMLKTDDSLTVALGVNIGTATGATAAGQLEIAGSTWPPLSVTRSTASTNSKVGTTILASHSTGNMTDGFGTELNFGIGDDGVAVGVVAKLGTVRDGNDTSGAFFIDVYATGAASEAFRIASDGETFIFQGLNIGAATGALPGNISGATDGTSCQWSQYTYRNTAQGSRLFMYKTRGTYATPLVVADNDVLGRILAYGYSQAAGAFVNAAAIRFEIDGTPDTGGDPTDMPGTIIFQTTPNGSGTLTTAGWVDPAQDWYRSDDSEHWSQVSDAQFKRDVTLVDAALDKLCLLQPIRFRYNTAYHEVNPDSNLERTHLGFTAQNFAKVFPEQVKDDRGYKIMNTTGLSALLVAGVQELNGHRVTADAEREAIRARLDSIERRE